MRAMLAAFLLALPLPVSAQTAPAPQLPAAGPFQTLGRVIRNPDADPPPRRQSPPPAPQPTPPPQPSGVVQP